MPLPTKPKKDPRSISLTVRLSKLTVDGLKDLANKHNLSQADVISLLIQQELKHLQKKGK